VTTIAELPSLPHDVFNAASDLYYATFEEINTLAAQRHLMTYHEFDEVMNDKSIRKFVASDDGGGMVGLAVITNDLEAWPLISPQYFARRWPEEAEQGRIWYVGFVAVRQNPRPRPHLFAEIIRAMYQPVIDSQGIAVMDYCLYNVQTRGVPAAAHRILERINPEVTTGIIDAQYFYGYRFDGQPW
jgi:hypothetical protein